MQLTRHTDYALRVLVQLAISSPDRVKVRDVAESFGVSHNHLVKVVQRLVQLGYVRTVAGREGGMHLAVPAREIIIAEVVEGTETVLAVVECLAPDGGNCPISPVCRLKRTLRSAQTAFFDVLRDVTIEDVAGNRAALRGLLKLDAKP